MSRFSVAIDARSADSRRSGIGNYTARLLAEFARIDSGITVVPIRRRRTLRRPEDPETLAFPGDTKSVSTLGMGFSLGSPLRRVHLFHSPADIVPPGLRCPWVVTTHDLMWLETPALCAAFAPERLVNAAWYRWHYDRAVRGARRVIAISQATADALARVYPDHAHKVRVIHHGVDLHDFARERARPRDILDSIIPSDVRYSLIVGQGSPYKNHAGMVRAFVEAMRDRREHKLVIVRRFARRDRAMNTLLARADVRRKVVVVPFVDDETLLALYRYAHALLFVSHAEGFGMPVLEAMALGTPVITSTAPALTEVTAAAALQVSSADHSALVDAIRLLDADEGLRTRLNKAGLERARQFSWTECARATLAVYREAISAAE